MDTYFPAIGSRWVHHTNPIPYTVVTIANVPATAKYPTTVVYVGPNAKMWTKTLEDFLSTMRPMVK